MNKNTITPTKTISRKYAAKHFTNQRNRNYKLAHCTEGNNLSFMKHGIYSLESGTDTLKSTTLESVLDNCDVKVTRKSLDSISIHF